VHSGHARNYYEQIGFCYAPVNTRDVVICDLALVASKFNSYGYVQVGFELWSNWTRAQSRRQLTTVMINPTQNMDMT
jgi:hypothetical protein